MTEIKNILIIGKEGKEKSRLANILLNKNGNFEEVFPERKEGDSSRSEPYQIEETVVDGTTYRIIDLIGLEDEVEDKQEFVRVLEELAKEIENDGINQIIATNDDVANWKKGKILKEEFFDFKENGHCFSENYLFERLWCDTNFLEKIVKNDAPEFKEKIHKEMWDKSNCGGNISHGLKYYQEVKFFPKYLENFLRREKDTNIIDIKNLEKEQEQLIGDEKVTIEFSEPYKKPVTNILLENWDKFRIYQFEDEKNFKELIAKIFKFIPDDKKWFRFSPEFLEKLQGVFKEKQEIFKKQSSSLKELSVGGKWIEEFEKSHPMNFFTIGDDEQWLSQEPTLEEERRTMSKSLLEERMKREEREKKREERKKSILKEVGPQGLILYGAFTGDIDLLKLSQEPTLEEERRTMSKSLLEERMKREKVKKSLLEITPQDLILVEGDRKNFLELIEKEFKRAEIISSNGYLFSQKVLEFLQLALKGENLTVTYEKGTELTLKEFANDKLESNIKVFLNNDICKKLKRLKKSRNILLMGRTGAGKSSLGNLLLDKEEVFKTSASSISETKGYQTEIFEDGIVPYRIIDLMGVGDTNLSEENTLLEISKVTKILNRGIHQVLFIIKGRFTAEEVRVFEMLEAIFKSEVAGHCTIVRTWFPNFQDPRTFEKDFNDLVDEEGKAKPILEKIRGRIIYLDNPSLVGSENRIEGAKKTRIAARDELMKYLRNNSRSPYIPDLNPEFLDRRIKGYLDPFEKGMWEAEEKLKELAKKLDGNIDFWTLKGKSESAKSELEKEVNELFIFWEKLWDEKHEKLEEQIDELEKKASELGLDKEEWKEKKEELMEIKNNFPEREKFDEMCSSGVKFRELSGLLINEIKKQIEKKRIAAQFAEKELTLQEKRESCINSALEAAKRLAYFSSEEAPKRSTIEGKIEELLLNLSREDLKKKLYLLPEEVNELCSLKAEINQLERRLVELGSQGMEAKIEVPPK